MTVKELMKKLSTMPENANVFLYVYDGECETSCFADYVLLDGFGSVIIGYEEDE